MSRVKNREVPPPTPTPVWMPWVSWGLDSNPDPDTTADQPPAFPDDVFGEDTDQQADVPRPLKRRTIVFSVSTTKHETVEHLGRSNRILMDSADEDDEPNESFVDEDDASRGGLSLSGKGWGGVEWSGACCAMLTHSAARFQLEDLPHLNLFLRT